ncbi:flagellar assembly protein FliH [Oceanobacillus kapialis]|uniref:Flagellar assembly protein FliH n=1 Tax=Oceanobacillus kapialis TaxID=481353 RepID=A0ABW5PYJ5_9BACI
MSDTHMNGGRVIKLKPIVTQTDKAHYLTPEEQVRSDLQQAQQSLQQIKEESASLLKKTDEQIELAKSNWEKEKKTLIESAKHEGYQDGFQSGKQEGLSTYETKLDELNQLTDKALKEYHQTVEKSTTEIIKIALHTAEKILDQKITEEPTAFLQMVQKSIKELKDQSIISIYLHPSNYEFVLQQKEELMQIVNEDTKLAIYMKDSIQENGCRIKHPFGELDIGLDTQLKQIREVLHEIELENRQ